MQELWQERDIMGRTDSQRTKSGKRNYGRNTARGDKGENRAIANLRRNGFSDVHTAGNRRGPWDVCGSKNGRKKKVQVKRISSRTFASKAAVRNRIRGKPYFVPSSQECWVYDGAGKLWKIPPD